ncbi:MAG: ABC transporter permease, partial [Pseudomonadota bacterium]
MLKKLVLGTAALGIAASVQTATPVFAEDTIYIPSLSYRTGPFAGAGTPIANGFADYFTMLNERDGGIGGAKIVFAP